MKIWIDPGHGGKDPGAIGCARRECDDNLTYAMELGHQMREQGMEAVMTRTDDCFVELDTRTALERRAGCSLAIACHRNSFTQMATGFEIWLHSNAPQLYVDWANEICDGVKSLGMILHGGQKINGKYYPGVNLGFPGYPKDNYYANSGTNSPSMLIEFGYMQNSSDNTFFDLHYNEVNTIIVKASCRFLGVNYKNVVEGESTTELKQQIAQLQDALQQEKAQRKKVKVEIVQDLLQLAEKYQL